jgi:Dynein heavy chain, N-terminal region 1
MRMQPRLLSPSCPPVAACTASRTLKHQPRSLACPCAACAPCLCPPQHARRSKDNVKFLSTLEKALEPMYEGTPQDIIDGVAALMDNIRMMHTIARYYSTAERMTTLFVKITNQMIAKCKEHILPDVKKPERLWSVPKPELIAKMQARRLPAPCCAQCRTSERRALGLAPCTLHCAIA